MRQLLVLLLVLMFLSAPVPSRAQTGTGQQPSPVASLSGACRPFDTPPLVVVTLRDGNRMRGTLTCLGDDVELATGGRLSRTPLQAVTKIAEPRDSVWDGAAIGAGIGAFFWAICGSDCNTGYTARMMADYALLGLVIDAATSHNKTIYKASRAPALSFSVRF